LGSPFWCCALDLFFRGTISVHFCPPAYARPYFVAGLKKASWLYHQRLTGFSYSAPRGQHNSKFMWHRRC